ncbi:MAG: hypothetical protein Q9M45_05250 [Robiginitomaculum sp.]|nr:hypothetical protein [Robiginitomaculum sp.]
MSNRLRASSVGAARALVEAGTERFRPTILTLANDFCRPAALC